MVRLGIIGCGAVTERHHLPALKPVRDIKVVALADQDCNRLEKLGREYQVPGRYPTWRELIDAGNVDAVAVCLPPQLHTEVALAALEQGKHLFIEKPVALNLADCDELIEASKRHSSRKIMVGFNLRWHRLLRQARDVINRNELGPIKSVRTVFTSRKQPVGWRTSPEAGGGVIFDLGVHHFDALRFLLESDVDAVHASNRGSDKTVTVMLSMNSGAQAICDFAEGTGENHAFEIYGARGSLRISCYRADGLQRFHCNENPRAITARLRALGNTLLQLPRAVYQSRRGGEFAVSYVEEWRRFAAAMLSDRRVEANLLDARSALEIALAASKAIAG